MIQVRLRDFFSTELFNVVIGTYFENFLGNFIERYLIESAKGSSGKDFRDSRGETVRSQFDMPYHVHILNGLLPTLKMLEERFKKEGWDQPDKREQADTFLRCFVIGFTFHDINKLTNVDDLNESVDQHLFILCDELKLERYFPDWKNWVEEIKFLALGTEYRTKIYAHQKFIKEYDFFNTVLAEYCHFADSIASIDGFANTADFYNQLCNKQFDGRKLSTLCQLSFVEVQGNIFTLLSQKLFFAAKDIIKDMRNQTILFNLRNGFVYIGEPLTKDEIQSIKFHLKSDLSDVIKSALLDFQTCKLGFLESLSEENESKDDLKYHAQIKNALEKILRAGFANSGAGSEKIRPFAITNYAPLLKEKNTKPQEIENLEKLLDENELPLTVFPLKANDGTVQNYFLRLHKEWDEIRESDKKFLKLYALEKMKILSSKVFTKWKPKVSYPEYSTATERTVIALMNAINLCQEAESDGKTIDDALASVWDEVIKTLTASSLLKTVDTKELDDFADFYLSGNFERDVNKVTGFVGEIPEKADMCLFTGRKAMTKYGAERAFGISALNFSNRSLNTLKSKPLPQNLWAFFRLRNNIN